MMTEKDFVISWREELFAGWVIFFVQQNIPYQWGVGGEKERERCAFKNVRIHKSSKEYAEGNHIWKFGLHRLRNHHIFQVVVREVPVPLFTAIKKGVRNGSFSEYNILPV